ncbi:MAG: response regulator transcription factor [Verrucomicrobia bacterium]|nr:response regulator transcription factor [Verrucomicrobiota bacterium]
MTIPSSPTAAAAVAARVLLVDDEPDVADLVRYRLQGAGHEVMVASDGLTALRLARERRPDLLVLDLMLPQMSGQEVCRQLKSDPETASIPIIMLTARGQPAERIAGLEIGADDYVTKPFSPRELLLRVGAVLRRVRAGEGSGARREAALEVGEFQIDKGAFEVRLAGRRLELTTTEFKLLCLLIERRGQTQSRERLLSDVWGYENAIDTRTVDTHVRRLREKLGPHAASIETSRGAGYRFRVPAAAETDDPSPTV